MELDDPGPGDIVGANGIALVFLLPHRYRQVEPVPEMWEFVAKSSRRPDQGDPERCIDR